MLETLPKPQVLRQGAERADHSIIPAIWLRWNHDTPATAEKIWYLPEDVCLTGPAPERFGLTIERQAADSYDLRLVWNGMYLSWHSLRRVQILASALNPLLRALGQDLWHLLEQPIHGAKSHPSLVA